MNKRYGPSYLVSHKEYNLLHFSSFIDFYKVNLFPKFTRKVSSGNCVTSLWSSLLIQSAKVISEFPKI